MPPERPFHAFAGRIHGPENLATVLRERDGLAILAAEDERREEDLRTGMILVRDHLEHAVAIEIGELDRDDPTRRRESLVIRPFGLERLPDDAIEPDLLAVGHDQPWYLILGRDRHVHCDDRERESTDLLERDRVLAARVTARFELAAEEPGQQRALPGLRRLPIAAR